MYIELLEKVFEAFDRIPNCIKDKFPGYDKKTYAKVKYYKSKLKTVINTKENNSGMQVIKSENSCEANNESNDTDASISLMANYGNDLDDFNLETSQVYGKKPMELHENIQTSTPDFASYNKPGPSKTIYSDSNIMAKKSLSFDPFSPYNDSKNDINNQSVNDSVNKSKGKFVFKKPSRLTEENTTPVRDIQSNIAERIRSATEKLKPITLEDIPKCSPMPNSSVDFQPPQLAKNSFMSYNKPCTIVSPIVKEMIPDEEDYDDIIPIDIDDTDVLPATNVVNLIDSVSNNSSIEIINNKEILVNDDGWPEYRIEDFEDDMETLTCANTEEINLMDQSAVESDGKAKYEGMGDFAAGTQNDGITGS